MIMVWHTSHQVSSFQKTLLIKIKNAETSFDFNKVSHFYRNSYQCIVESRNTSYLSYILSMLPMLLKDWIMLDYYGAGTIEKETHQRMGQKYALASALYLFGTCMLFSPLSC